MTGGWNFTEAQCKMFLFPVILAKLERWLSSFKLPKLTCTCNAQIACWFFFKEHAVVVVFLSENFRFEDESDFGTRFELKFFHWFSKNWHPESFIVLFFFSKKLALLSLLKEVKPSPGRKIIKPPTFENFFPPTRHYRSYKTRSRKGQRLSHFPAKISLVHARALLRTEKISHS